MQFVPDLFKTQEMCDKAVGKCLFVFYSVPNQHKTQEILINSFLKILLS